MVHRTNILFFSLILSMILIVSLNSLLYFSLPQCYAGKSMIWVFAIVGISLAFLRLNIMYENESALVLSKLVDSGEQVIVNFEGTIVREPIKKGQKIQYILGNLFNIETNNSISGKVILKYRNYPEFYYGDRLQVSGIIVKPEPFDGFLYDQYLAMKGVSATFIRLNHLKFIKEDNLFLSPIYKLKKIIISFVSRIIPEPHASFLNGLLFGAKDGLPENIASAFQVTGLTHIIAISGYNITLIIIIVLFLFGFIPKNYRLILSAIFIVVFTLFVGPEASVVRASVMGIIMLLAIYTGRSAQIFNTLLITAFLMVIYNPRVLIYDVGFQLSFLATLGLVYVSPLLERYFLWVPNFFELRESLLLTISAQITAVPIIMYHFGTLSVISVLANILVTPFIPLSMLFGSIAILLGTVNQLSASFFGFFAYISLEIILQVAERLSKFPYAYLENIKISFIALSFYYLMLLLILFTKHKNMIR
jgi:competence protein ComEC